MGKHVTFWKMKAAPGKRDELITMMSDQATSAEMRTAGWELDIAGSSKDNPDEIWGCVVWDTSERYYANADSPAQNAIYEKMRALLASDPEWHDCDLLAEDRA